MSLISKMIQDRTIVTMECEYETANGTISNDLE